MAACVLLLLARIFEARLSAHVDQNHGLKFAAASRPPVATDRFLYFFAQTFAKLKATFDALEAARCVRTPWVREARVPYDHEFEELHVRTSRLGDGHPPRLRRRVDTASPTPSGDGSVSVCVGEQVSLIVRV